MTEQKDRTMNRLIKEPKELYEFLSTPAFHVINFVFDNDDVVWISWKYGAEDCLVCVIRTR